MTGLGSFKAGLAALVAVALWPTAASGQSRAQIKAQYDDECSTPTDDPDVLASCDIMAQMIGESGVKFTGDYPAIPSREGAGFATNLKLGLYKQNCSVPKPTATADQCNGWRRDIEQAYSELDFPKKPKAAPPPPTEAKRPACNGCPTRAAQ